MNIRGPFGREPSVILHAETNSSSVAYAIQDLDALAPWWYDQSPVDQHIDKAIRPGTYCGWCWEPYWTARWCGSHKQIREELVKISPINLNPLTSHCIIIQRLGYNNAWRTCQYQSFRFWPIAILKGIHKTHKYATNERLGYVWNVPHPDAQAKHPSVSATLRSRVLLKTARRNTWRVGDSVQNHITIETSCIRRIEPMFTMQS